MKSKLLKNILIIFGAFLVVAALYFGVFVRQKIDLVRTLNMQEKVVMLRKSDLVESRLALVGVANGRISDSGFFESFSADMEMIGKGLQTSKDFLESKEVELIEEKMVKEDREVWYLIGTIYTQVQDSFTLYNKLLEYDIAKDLSGPLGDENYEDLLGRVLNTLDGLEQFLEDEYLGEETQVAINELSVARVSLENENYEDLFLELEIAVLNYNLLKIKAFKRVLEPIRSEQGVDMLVRLTNLIVSYEGEVGDIARSKQEVTNSIPAGSGFLSIFNIE